MGLFYSLGKAVGPKIRKGKWMWQSLAGTEADAIAAENAAGADLASEVARQVKLDPDPATQNLITDIGLRLAACVKNKHRIFHFAAVESAEPNAFALPGGFIYITSGLLELCHCTPDEIAFVLAHEMAHVIRGHPMERIVSDSAVTTLSRATPLRGVLGAWLKRVGIQFLQSAYSQDRELEADKLGTRLLGAAHFNGAAAADLFGRLAEIDRQGQLAELSSYFSSHPQLPDRIAAVTAAAKKQKRQ